jgi:hypothetical protein
MDEKRIWVAPMGYDDEGVWVRNYDTGEDYAAPLDLSFDGEGHWFNTRRQHEIALSDLSPIKRERIIAIAERQSRLTYDGKTDELFDVFAGKITPEEYIKEVIAKGHGYRPLFGGFGSGHSCLAGAYQAIVVNELELLYTKMGYPKKEEEDLIEGEKMVLCTCGHYCPESLVMSTSRGSSCPVCYDDMRK